VFYREILADARFYDFLARCDAEIAAAARSEGCGVCGGTVHAASYPRKPRGGPEDLGSEYERRHSFCCARDGCRSRLTPPSLRFLGRKVYLGAVVVLVSAMQHGVSPRRGARLREVTGVSRRTLKRWRTWWREAFAASPFWRAASGRFATPVARELLPQSLLERFGGESAEVLTATLRFLSPITTANARNAMAF
jgi:hypothetical protein